MPPRPRLRRLAAYAALIGVALIGTVALAELFLRFAPIPGITYHTFYYDELTGQRFYPNTTMIYRNGRGDHVRRRVNDWGYLDAHHEIAKPAGVVRIGFFGDSFTEARQVPLERTFHCRLQDRLNRGAQDARTECIAIAMMGYSTLQSWLECERWMDRLDLDHVVYVFCENDPGNHIRALNEGYDVPYPILVGDSLAVDASFAARNAHKTRRMHRSWQYLKSHSLLVSTLETRLRLLQARGFDDQVEDADRTMAAPANRKAPVDALTPPSLWPDSLRAAAAALTESVMVHWKHDVERSGRTFLVAYIPRPAAVKSPGAPSDDWRAWLHDVCKRNGIDLLDPTERLTQVQQGGRDVFFDHLTDTGHDAFAAELLPRFRPQPPDATPSP